MQQNQSLASGLVSEKRKILPMSLHEHQTKSDEGMH